MVACVLHGHWQHAPFLGTVLNCCTWRLQCIVLLTVLAILSYRSGCAECEAKVYPEFP